MSSSDTASDTLIVILEARPIGRVQRTTRGLRLVYDDGYLDAPNATLLSAAMAAPIREHTDRVVTPWLWGLLPDNADVLTRWAREFGVSGVAVPAVDDAGRPRLRGRRAILQTGPHQRVGGPAGHCRTADRDADRRPPSRVASRHHELARSRTHRAVQPRRRTVEDRAGNHYRLRSPDRPSSWRGLADDVGLPFDDVVSRVLELTTRAAPAFAEIAAHHDVATLASDLPARLTDAVASRADHCSRVLS